MYFLLKLIHPVLCYGLKPLEVLMAIKVTVLP